MLKHNIMYINELYKYIEYRNRYVIHYNLYIVYNITY